VLVHLHEHKQKGESFMYFSVEDDGEGIEPAQQDRIFDKYAQLDSRNKGKGGGTGLGLAVSQMIIEQHGGVVGYQDRKPKGSIFYFQLPCQPTDAVQSKPAK
jgi:signal transduction histidine kinase